MKAMLVLSFAATLLSGCVVAPIGPRHAYVDGGAVVVAPPVVVRPYYRPYYGGYYRWQGGYRGYRGYRD